MNPKLFLSILISTLLLSNIVLAVPGIPHAFYGSVKINGQPAPDGTSVVAKINGVEVSSTTTLNGKYSGSRVLIVEDPLNNRAGKTIQFFVKGIDTGKTETFLNGGSTDLDLSISSSEDTGEGNGGNGGGGGDGGVTTTTITEEMTTTVETCQEKWTCIEWSECEEGVQTRTCTDENECGTDLYKPFESQPCATRKAEEGSLEKIISPITGLFTSATMPIIIGLVIVIIILVVYVLRKIRSKGEAEEKSEEEITDLLPKVPDF